MKAAVIFVIFGLLSTSFAGNDQENCDEINKNVDFRAYFENSANAYASGNETDLLRKSDEIIGAIQEQCLSNPSAESNYVERLVIEGGLQEIANEMKAKKKIKWYQWPVVVIVAIIDFVLSED